MSVYNTSIVYRSEELRMPGALSGASYLYTVLAFVFSFSFFLLQFLPFIYSMKNSHRTVLLVLGIRVIVFVMAVFITYAKQVFFFKEFCFFGEDK